MEELQEAMDQVLLANPEMTFFEVCAELVTKGELNFEATEDPSVHVFLHQLFQRAKVRANVGKANLDM